MISYGLLIPLAESLQGFFDVLIVEAENDGTVINVQVSYSGMIPKSLPHT